MTVSVFGIRHHGPGSARSLLAALAQYAPDIVLVEGPPDANDLIPTIGKDDLVPPVALLVYASDEPQRASFFPFARYSPEWQALRYANEHEVPARFIDLPQKNRFAVDRADETAGAEGASETPSDSDPAAGDRFDPLSCLASAAGFDDGERWWEALVEERRNSREIFDAVSEAMGALREEVWETLSEPLRLRDHIREAFMRQQIRAAKREKFEKIAVVCGAWHAPALLEMPTAASDQARLKGLPRTRTCATWIPWTYGRLSFHSGYGAGVDSPGYYDHVWEHEDGVATRWLTRVARLLREEDLMASSAQVIDALRLAETLAVLRGRARPGLSEFQDSTLATLLHGETLPLALIRNRLIVGERMGSVPDDAPRPPIVEDLTKRQRKLRLKPTTEDRELVLDLRKPLDRERSALLRCLEILEVSWGVGGHQRDGKGTFKEEWRLQWNPELEIPLVEAGFWGSTVTEAATRRTLSLAKRERDLAKLTLRTRQALFAGLEKAVPPLLARLADLAAISTEVSTLLRALPELAQLIRYGSVRDIETTTVEQIFDEMVIRTSVGLPVACRGLTPDAAQELFLEIDAAHQAITLLDRSDVRDPWIESLRQVLEDAGAAALLRGRACRLLHASGAIEDHATAQYFGRALSVGTAPDDAAQWVEGFLHGSGQILIHDDALLQIVDSWIVSLPGELFVRLLPLIRRTFATFSGSELQQIGRLISRSGSTSNSPSNSRSLGGTVVGEINHERARPVLPKLARLLGVEISDDR